MRTIAVAVVILSACFMQTVSASFLRSGYDPPKGPKKHLVFNPSLWDGSWYLSNKKEVATKDNAHLTEARQQTKKVKKVDMQQELIRQRVDHLLDMNKVDQELTRKQQKQQLKHAKFYAAVDMERAKQDRYHLTHQLQTARWKVRDLFQELIDRRRKYDERCVKRRVALKKEYKQSWFLYHNYEDNEHCKDLHSSYTRWCEDHVGGAMVKSETASKLAKMSAEFCPYTEGVIPLCKSALNTMVSQFSKSMIKYKKYKDTKAMGEDACRIMWSNHGKQLHLPSNKWSRNLHLKADLKKSKHQGSKKKHQRVNKRSADLTKMNKDLASVAAR